MSISSARDFRYLERQASAPDVAIDDPTLTLYCLDRRRKQAVFVQTEADVDLAAAPFYYQAQYRHARGALVMPLPSMVEVARSKGDRFEHAVTIYHCGRSGSTLLSRMFGCLPDCLSLSEPDAYTRVLCDGFEPSSIETLLESATRLYFQPPATAQPTHLVVKLRSFCVQLAGAVRRATPRSIPLFLYRNVWDVVASGMRAFRYHGSTMWWCDRLHAAQLTRPVLACALAANRGLGERLLPAAARFSSVELSRMGAVGVLAVAWVSAMERCAALASGGVDIRAVRYEDLIGPNRMTVIAALLEHCRLPTACAETMVTALRTDSQAGSIVERARQRAYTLTEGDRAAIRQVLSRSDVVDGDGFRPGTGVPHLYRSRPHLDSGQQMPEPSKAAP